MNTRVENDIIQYISECSFSTQREVADTLGCAVGSVNQAVKSLQQKGMLSIANELSEQGRQLVEANHPKRAVILAAGAGMRMVPINRAQSKGMLQVHGETLVERLIKQLHAVDVTEIYIVVGFMKEQYEYLMDKYQVELIVNREYDVKNNLWSLAKASKHLEEAYVIPCDIYCQENPFHKCELYSWYLVQEEKTRKSDVSLNRKGELVRIDAATEGNQMIGIAYLDIADGTRIADKLDQMKQNPEYEDCFWEEALYEKNRMIISGKVDRTKSIYELNTYEQLRALDTNSIHLESDVLYIIADTFGVSTEEISKITVLKTGMTNRSFLFTCKGKRYIMRIPGEGTDQMINRKQEYQVYETIRGEHICDDICYINPETGYKITAFLENARNCDAENREEVAACMKLLRSFHEKKLQVDHTFDMFEQIDFYEGLWNGEPSVYRDYQETKQHVLELKSYIDRQEKDFCLTHIDANADNFLFCDEGLRLIDWEYAGMQDPHVDIAMFAIYSMYDRAHVERLIDLYFPEGCKPAVRKKIYCYIAVAGLLWSNWCEYKRQLGVEFGEYSLRQYRYAKEYYKIFHEYKEEQHA
ncbi:MAG: phosphocholine cytidylyltransferase/choline kinase family protein [Lachnospiraceae bacterium]|nr:phosphocholine cytidylyltransferase/choline kinase family protein [Lachnospiraceae bacterium]